MKKKFLLNESYIPQAGDEIHFQSAPDKGYIVIDTEEAIQINPGFVSLHECHYRDDFLFYCKIIIDEKRVDISWASKDARNHKHYYLRDIKHSRLDFE